MNILEEINFLKDSDSSFILPIILTFLNAPSVLYEIFPFIFLISTQVFFNNLFTNNEMNILKYSGLKNSKIFSILSITTFLLGIFLVFIFYNFSSNLKYFYLG